MALGPVIPILGGYLCVCLLEKKTSRAEQCVQRAITV